MRKLRRTIVSLLVTLLAGTFIFVQSVSAEDELSIRAFYGDRALDRVVVIDVGTMGEIASISTYGADPYPVDQAGTLEKVYAITRGSDSIDVIDADSFEHLGIIELEHYPRSSEAYNPVLGLQLVTGADKPMATLIEVETDEVVASVGDNTLVSPIDYGGSNATGHPFWFTDNKFALIDRANRNIQMYHVTRRKGKNDGWKVMLIDSISTPTAVHHFVKRDTSELNGKQRHTYYALSEGAPDEGISPSILKYLFKDGRLHLMGEAALATEDIEDMGSHHADVHPNGAIMYVGSTEGNIYVVHMEKMKVMKTIKAGLGAGHTTFIPERDIAVVTNHKDTFVSIIDTLTHQNIKDVKVSESSDSGEILQSHSSFVSPDMDFFYAFATATGIFYELNLETLEVERTLDTGGTPLQGVFMCQGAECENKM